MILFALFKRLGRAPDKRRHYLFTTVKWMWALLWLAGCIYVWLAWHELTTTHRIPFGLLLVILAPDCKYLYLSHDRQKTNLDKGSTEK